MREETIERMSKQALTNGYMFKPFAIYNFQDRDRAIHNAGNMFRNQAINDFMIYNVVDRLTYVRDYHVRKSINFMMTVKDKKSETIAFAEMVYSKNSEMLYVKTFKCEEEHCNKEVLSLAIKGAKDYLNDYGMKFNNIITSPQIGVDKKELEVMMDMGMKFMAFTPKTDYGELEEAKENIPSEKNEVILFPFKEQLEKIKPHDIMEGKEVKQVKQESQPKSKFKEIKTKKEEKVEKKEDKKEEKEIKELSNMNRLWFHSKKLELEKEILKEMHVLLVKKYDLKKEDLDVNKFKLFLNDVKNEEKELTYLYELFKQDDEINITIKKMSEVEKLLLLFKNWGDDMEDEKESSSEKVDKTILGLIKDYEKRLRKGLIK
jgi:hypothetical protein